MAKKFTPATVTMLMLVSVAGLIGLYVVKGLLKSEPKIEPPQTVTVPLATAHLAPGTKITDAHVGLGPLSIKEVKGDLLRSTRVIIGRVVKEVIEPGKPLHGSQLYEPGANAPLEVAEGKLAMAVTVKHSADLVDGLIKPGNFVDVHFTLESQNRDTVDSRISPLGGVSMTLFKGVKILAVNKTFRQGPVLATGNSVTLELARDQINVLLVTHSRGAISLTFNPTGEGDGGVALSNTERVTLWEVLGLKKPVVKESPPPEKPFETVIYRGSQQSSRLWDKEGRIFRDDRSGAVRGVSGTNDADNAVDPGDVFTTPNPQDRASGANAGPPREPAVDPGTPRTLPPAGEERLKDSPARPRPLPRPTDVRSTVFSNEPGSRNAGG